MKKGKFGLFVTWGENKKSVNYLKKEECEITVDDVVGGLQQPSNPNMLRVINGDLSIRNGKYGAYIFYKTTVMKKPRFLKLNGFKEDYKTCEMKILQDWIRETYKIEC